MRPTLLTACALLGALTSLPAVAQDGLRLDADGQSASARLAKARLDAEVTRRGLELRSTEPGDDWSLTLTTYAVGAKGAVRDMAAARELRVAPGGIEMHRDGFVERHAADETGASLSWDLDAAAFAGDGAAWIALRLTGLSAVVDGDGRGALLVDGAGMARAVLRGVTAFDASGRALSARLEQDADGLGVVVPGRGAALPVRAEARIDRLEHAAESPEAAPARVGDLDGDGFGDRVAVGADGASVEVYRGGPAGFDGTPSWTVALGEAVTAAIVAGDVDGDGFEDLAVGLGRSSSVALLRGASRGLAQRPSQTLSGDEASAFGASLAALGDVDGDGFDDIAIGAPRANDGAGSVHAYRGSAAGLDVARGAAWTSSDVDDGARVGFGSSLGPSERGREGSLLVGSTAGGAVCLHAPLGASAVWPSRSRGLALRTAVDGDVTEAGLRHATAGDTLTVEVAATDPSLEGESGVLLVTYVGDRSSALARDRAVDPTSVHTQRIPFTASVRGGRIALPLPASTTPAGGGLVLQAMAGAGAGVSAAPNTSGNVGVVLIPSPVHVSISTGANHATGRKDDPVRLVSQGLAIAENAWSPATGHPELLITTGTYTETNVIDHPISMRGGLDPATWAPSQTASTVLAANNGGTRFDGITVPTTIERIEFRSADGAPNSSTGGANVSRAVLVVDSTEALVFEDCMLRAGDGGTGANGFNQGGAPPVANNGEGGDNADIIPYTDKTGGVGGFGTGINNFSSMWGGGGGDGTVTSGNGHGLQPFFLEEVFGLPVPRFLGCSVPGASGSFFGTVATKSGDDGGHGGPGPDGTGGVTAQFRGVELSNGSWRSGVGTDGSAGASGCAGAGGGGGTGFFWSTPFPPFYYEWDGAGGGGGGAGGYGGNGGTAGTNGGASFAAQLIDASPRFRSCELFSGVGGRGGNGGAGWPGGAGGIGGGGGNSFDGSFGALGASITVGLGAGGDGGNGGMGGHGGGGAGGHGGPSYCIYAGGSSTTPGLFTSNNVLQFGSGGAPGSGGHQAQSGVNGAHGITW